MWDGASSPKDERRGGFVASLLRICPSGNFWQFAWRYRSPFPFSVFLGSPWATTYLKHASELDIFSLTQALALQLITLDMKDDQE